MLAGDKVEVQGMLDSGSMATSLEGCHVWHWRILRTTKIRLLDKTLVEPTVVAVMAVCQLRLRVR